LKRTLPFLHYSHENFLFFEVPLRFPLPKVTEEGYLRSRPAPPP
jgi:hypothetical protein